MLGGRIAAGGDGVSKRGLAGSASTDDRDQAGIELYRWCHRPSGISDRHAGNHLRRRRPNGRRRADERSPSWVNHGLA